MLFTEFKLKDYIFKNRIVMAPMCMYQARDKGLVEDFHIIHYGARAISGVGAIIVEATAIEPRGRITNNDLLIDSDETLPGLSKLAKTIKEYGAIAGIQLAHAGRKSKTNLNIIAPSPINFPNYKMPLEMTTNDIKEIIAKFKDAAIRADKAGFDLIEIHAAHGYLINEFLSPITNKRTDKYGGDLKGRFLFLKEIFTEIKKVWPKDKLLGIRVSGTEFSPEGTSIADLVYILTELKTLGIDFVDVSSGGIILANINTYPGYQIEYAKELKAKTNIPTMGGGLITSPSYANNILKENNLDFIYFGRELLRNPNYPYYAAKELNKEFSMHKSYIRAK